jgi:negative regulator of flagellin synthesis FlgM
MKVTNNKLPNSMPSTESAKSAKLGGAESILDGKKAKGADVVGADGLSSTRIDVSPRAQELRKAKELATPSDSIDEAKVARLQKMIDSGSYKVDAEAISERLLDEYGKMPS